MRINQAGYKKASPWWGLFVDGECNNITPLAKGQWKLYCPKATLFHLRGALSQPEGFRRPQVEAA